MSIKYQSSKIFQALYYALFLGMLVSLFVLSFCSDRKSENRTKAIDPNALKEPLIEANKELVKSEEEQINDYIRRYNWKMNTTESGLRYLVYKQGSGEFATNNMIAKVNYSVELLNGELCYSSEEDGPKEFVIGSGQVESGLNEAILLLKVGDRAKIIIPSHLAFGLAGDKDKIPIRASLIYDIELLDLKQQRQRQ